MMTVARLERLASRGSHDRLLTDVLSNGRDLPLAARLRFSQAETLPGAAMGLALQRLTELTHRPCPTAIDLALRLLELQSRHGHFGAIAATPPATAGLIALLEQAEARPGCITPELTQRIGAAIEIAMHSLYAAQEESRSGEHPGLIGDELESALAIWQLSGSSRFRTSVRVEELVSALERSGALDRQDVVEIIALTGDGKSRRHPRVAA